MNHVLHDVPRLETGLSGLDAITRGGLPQARSTLVTGTAGTGKTVLAVQFLAQGISTFRQNGVFVTCEEAPEDIRRNSSGLGFDISAWEKEGRWRFVDASPDPDQPARVTGRYDLEGLLARVEHACGLVKASRVSVDSIGSLLGRLDDGDVMRLELHRVFAHLKSLGVTVVITAERRLENGPVARYGVEEFVADNVMVLRNNHEHRSRRRTMEILKMRGADHMAGEWPFAISPGRGLQVVPHEARESGRKVSNQRVTIGQPQLDEMMGGGVYRGSTTLVSGAPGTGKTLLVSHFAGAGSAPQERCLLVAFEEGREQLVRNASGWGLDFEDLESRGRLCIHCSHPDAAGPEQQLIDIRNLLEEFRPTRLVVDGLTAMENVAGEQGKYDFMMGITAMIRHRDLACLLTSSTPALLGGQSITECRASTLADAIILLRYAEVCGAIARSITVLKVRGSDHDSSLRELKIDDGGMHIGQAFSNVSGVLSGSITVVTDDELARTQGVLDELRGAATA